MRLPLFRLPSFSSRFSSAALVAAVAALASAGTLFAQVKFTQTENAVHVEIDGQPYTDFIFRGGDAMKPYLYPLRSATGKLVTRHFPMEKVEGEPTDHPHQRGLWFAHEKVNGFDFWNNEATYKTANRGRILLDKVEEATGGDESGTLKVLLNWFDTQDKKLVEESRVMVFHKSPTLRILDFDITLKAVEKVTFGDAKDGAFGIRIAPVLQETSAGARSGDTMPQHTGTITNAEGLQHEKEVWGKPSDWADYSGEIDGEKVGIAILDHPSNTRRARWHVRGYGLFAANPFGLQVFTKDKSQDGSMTLDAGQTARFRYRVIIHPGDAKSADIAKLWTDYLGEVK